MARACLHGAADLAHDQGESDHPTHGSEKRAGGHGEPELVRDRKNDSQRDCASAAFAPTKNR
jgi:hypothetical protein